MTGKHVAFVLAAAFVAGGCAALGGQGSTAGSPDPAATATETVELPPDTARVVVSGSTEERLAAGDYAGVLAVYTADSSLHAEEDATYHAAIAAAMSGHRGHDPRLAADLFGRLLERHPSSSRRPAVELYLDLLTRHRDLRAANERLGRELEQLKAIDLGQAPQGAEP